MPLVAFTLQNKARVVNQYGKTGSLTQTQRIFTFQYHAVRPTSKKILSWSQLFNETGCLNQREGNRPFWSSSDVQSLNSYFYRYNRSQSVKHLKICRYRASTVHRIVRQNINLFLYRIHTLQKLTNTDYASIIQFAQYCISRVKTNANFIVRISSSDERAFQVFGSVKRHKICI